jgi:hypothetical protein
MAVVFFRFTACSRRPHCRICQSRTFRLYRSHPGSQHRRRTRSHLREHRRRTSAHNHRRRGTPRDPRSDLSCRRPRSRYRPCTRRASRSGHQDIGARNPARRSRGHSEGLARRHRSPRSIRPRRGRSRAPSARLGPWGFDDSRSDPGGRPGIQLRSIGTWTYSNPHRRSAAREEIGPHYSNGCAVPRLQRRTRRRKRRAAGLRRAVRPAPPKAAQTSAGSRTCGGPVAGLAARPMCSRILHAVALPVIAASRRSRPPPGAQRMTSIANARRRGLADI